MCVQDLVEYFLCDFLIINVCCCCTCFAQRERGLCRIYHRVTKSLLQWQHCKRVLLAQPIGIGVQLGRYVWGSSLRNLAGSPTLSLSVDFYYPWFLQYFTFALSVALFLKCMDTGLTYLGLKADLLSLGLFWFFLYLDHCQNHHWFGHFTQ